MIAALFVEAKGIYASLSGVDLWPEGRDARAYAGPYPVVAHPPCNTWGRLYWRTGRARGDDGGCFAAALASVRRWGGVLEHPSGSGAWPVFGLRRPPTHGGWVAAGDGIGWTCHVEQGHYGHRAQKPTWLYAVASSLPALKWGPCLQAPYCVELMGHAERARTPRAFAKVLIGMAGKVSVSTGSVVDRAEQILRGCKVGSVEA